MSEVHHIRRADIPTQALSEQAPRSYKNPNRYRGTSFRRRRALPGPSMYRRPIYGAMVVLGGGARKPVGSQGNLMYSRDCIRENVLEMKRLASYFPPPTLSDESRDPYRSYSINYTHRPCVVLCSYD